eukprot:TRINITY_DN31416_c0_g1_i1.p1 TRINITY_DN31416_c0_g1~~TRINITY_DN31416_c0_g1_i1.p1  ORF type:complete len:308 (+),score=47.57 TRINITY_DN31416_c0_g1_i1:41-964(+)
MSGRYLNVTDQNVAILSKYKVIVFDCDGVVWIHEDPIPGSTTAIRDLKKSGKKTHFVTNLSASKRTDLQKKFIRLGYDVAVDEISTSASTTASVMIKDGFKGKMAYIVGEKGLAAELEAVGIKTCGHDHDSNLPKVNHHEFLQEKMSPETVDAVVVGMDWGASYRKVAKAAIYVQKGAKFYATNSDKSSPTSSGLALPAAGSLSTIPISIISRTEPILVGKPTPQILLDIMSSHNYQPSTVLMVGDRLDTDILFGISAGVDTLLVLSGNTTSQQVRETPVDKQPTYVADSIDIFNKMMRGSVVGSKL